MTYLIHTIIFVNKRFALDTNTVDSFAPGGFVDFRGHCSVDAWLC